MAEICKQLQQHLRYFMVQCHLYDVATSLWDKRYFRAQTTLVVFFLLTLNFIFMCHCSISATHRANLYFLALPGAIYKLFCNLSVVFCYFFRCGIVVHNQRDNEF